MRCGAAGSMVAMTSTRASSGGGETRSGFPQTPASVGDLIPLQRLRKKFDQGVTGERKDRGKRKEGVSVSFVFTSSLKQRKTAAGSRCSGELFPAVWGSIS